jgi:hypothetical protein
MNVSSKNSPRHALVDHFVNEGLLPQREDVAAPEARQNVPAVPAVMMVEWGHRVRLRLGSIFEESINNTYRHEGPHQPKSF